MHSALFTNPQMWTKSHFLLIVEKRAAFVVGIDERKS
jgi:hypothetical protein